MGIFVNKSLPSSLTQAGSHKLFIESIKNEKEPCCYRNIINYCDFDGRGGVAKERKEVKSVTESGTEIEIPFFGKPKCLKTSSYPYVFKFKVEGKK